MPPSYSVLASGVFCAYCVSRPKAKLANGIENHPPEIFPSVAPRNATTEQKLPPMSVANRNKSPRRKQLGVSDHVDPMGPHTVMPERQSHGAKLLRGTLLRQRITINFLSRVAPFWFLRHMMVVIPNLHHRYCSTRYALTCLERNCRQLTSPQVQQKTQAKPAKTSPACSASRTSI